MRVEGKTGFKFQVSGFRFEGFEKFERFEGFKKFKSLRFYEDNTGFIRYYFGAGEGFAAAQDEL